MITGTTNTAEDFLVTYGLYQNEDKEEIIFAMKEYTKFHLEASIRAIVKDNRGNMNEADIPYLLKSYSLENIK